MKDQRKTEIKVGVTVFFGLLIFLWVLGWAKNWTVNAQRKEIKVEFSSVAGLEVGDPVTVNGVRKGYVAEISTYGNSVLTLLNFPGEVILNEDARFSVMMLDLMGGKKVEVNPGISKNELDKNKLYKGEFLGDVASAMAMLGSVQNDLVDVIKEVKISLSTLNKTMADQKFTSDIKTSVANLVDLTDNLNKLVVNNRDEINKLLTSGIEITKTANEFIKTNRDSISQTISSINAVLNVSKDLLSKVNDFMDKTDQSRNNLGKMLNDPDLMNDLRITIQQVKELTKVLVEQLKSKGIEVNAHIF
ncbi:MAG: ABC transporter substrate-binding protein [Ignavibacteriae bacterium HGW-Ignavibacteriae-3]|nr:MAG: ABC transporter substrate-binding protein [Ignavibacteriae bacterium HGW-Ignavibacteriae-3]